MSATTTATAELLWRVSKLAAEPPVAGRARAAVCVLDHLGCALAGITLTHVQPHLAIARACGVGSESTSVDGVVRTARDAAYVNGTAANALDFDDTLHGHPGAPIIAAALAVAERADASLGQLFTAVVAGYEAHWMLARASAPSPARAAEVRGVAAWDTMSAAVAAAIVAGLPEGELERALGIAATHAIVPYIAKWYERPMPTVKNNLGWVASAGVLAADLAAAGGTGLPAALDGPAGFWRMAGSDRWDWDSAKETPGPGIMRGGFKRYPACWHLQQYLAAADRLLRGESRSDGRAARAVTVRGPRSVQKFDEPSVGGTADVAFSIRTLIALLVLGLEPGTKWASENAIAMTRTLVDQISVEIVPAAQAAVEIRWDDGTCTAIQVADSDYDNPSDWGATTEEVAEKFTRLATPVLGEAAEELRAAVLGDDYDLSVRRVMSHLRR